jgi:hypothetical protein
MTPAQLRKAGEALARNDPKTYGRGWQSALGRVLGVGSRTVRAWLAGEYRMTQATGMLIKRLVEESRGNH